MSDQTLKAMSNNEKIQTLLNAAALVIGFAKLQSKGELEGCRLGLRQLWKGFTDDSTPQRLRHEAEIVLDCFFDFEGDMLAAAESIKKAINALCPNTLHDMVESKLELRAARNATEILEAKPGIRVQIDQAVKK